MAGLTPRSFVPLTAVPIFLNPEDAGGLGDADAVVGEAGQRALVIATRHDYSVPFAHAESLASVLPNAELVESRADSHMTGFGPDYSRIATKIGEFLAAG